MIIKIFYKKILGNYAYNSFKNKGINYSYFNCNAFYLKDQDMKNHSLQIMNQIFITTHFKVTKNKHIKRLH